MRNHFLAVAGVTLLVLVAMRGLLRPPSPDLLHCGRGVVKVAVADLLSEPDEPSSLADQAVIGDTLRVLRQSAEGFVEVETAARYRGHVRMSALVPLPSGAPPYADGGPILRVRSRFANIYERPDVTLRNPLLVAPLGARLRLQTEHDQRWLQVALPDGRQAFVQQGDVTRERGRFTARCIIDHALRHEGTPYLWGGRSTYGIDCSGLAANAYAACGVILPRDSELQYGWQDMVPVDGASLRAGDLIFFGPEAEPSWKAAALQVTHVGIYLGNERFVHATTSDRPDVHVSDLSAASWQRRLIGMRHHPGLRP